MRTSDRKGLDPVLDWSAERWAVEVKLTSSPGPGGLCQLDATTDLIDASRRFLVCWTRQPIEETGGRPIRRRRCSMRSDGVDVARHTIFFVVSC